MRIFLTVFALMFVFLSCDDGKKNLAADEDSIAINDADVENDADVDEATTDDAVDEAIVPDEDVVIVERSPEGIGVSSGTGTISSGSYKMELTVGKPMTGQLMKSNNYKLEIRIK